MRREIIAITFVLFELFYSETINAEEDVQDLIDQAQRSSQRAANDAKAFIRSLAEADINSVSRMSKIPLDHKTPIGQSKEINAHNSGRCGTACKSQEFNINQKVRAVVHLLIFVSSSMSSESIKAVGQAAQKIGGRLVLRGLIGGTFKETQNFIQDLGIIAEIDPTKFEDYQVSQVPTFILAHNNVIDRVAGHISIWEALDQFRRRGELKEEAKKLYLQLKQSVSRGARS